MVLIQLEIAAKKENKALKREEVLLKAAETKVTPSRKELRPKIAAMLNAKEQLVVIDKIEHPFGKRETSIRASVYQSEAALKKAAPKHLVERDMGKKKEAKEKPKPAAKKQEEKGEKAKPAESEKTEPVKEGQKPGEKPEKAEGKPAEKEQNKEAGK